MEPEGSLPCSQEPATDPTLSQSRPVHTRTSCFFNVHFNIIPTVYVWIFQLILLDLITL
jgi:hypothetical protein